MDGSTDAFHRTQEAEIRVLLHEWETAAGREDSLYAELIESRQHLERFLIDRKMPAVAARKRVLELEGAAERNDARLQQDQEMMPAEMVGDHLDLYWRFQDTSRQAHQVAVTMQQAVHPELRMEAEGLRELGDLRQDLMSVAERLNPTLGVRFVRELFGEGQNLLHSGAAEASRMEVAGMFQDMSNLATISLAERFNNRDTIYHEAFHSLERVLSEREKRVLRAAFPPQGQMTCSERCAIAFADWALKREARDREELIRNWSGDDALTRKTLRTAMRRMAVMRGRTRQALLGRGYEKAEKIFDKIFTGEMGRIATKMTGKGAGMKARLGLRPRYATALGDFPDAPVFPDAWLTKENLQPYSLADRDHRRITPFDYGMPDIPTFQQAKDQLEEAMHARSRLPAPFLDTLAAGWIMPEGGEKKDALNAQYFAYDSDGTINHAIAMGVLPGDGKEKEKNFDAAIIRSLRGAGYIDDHIWGALTESDLNARWREGHDLSSGDPGDVRHSDAAEALAAAYALYNADARVLGRRALVSGRGTGTLFPDDTPAAERELAERFFEAVRTGQAYRWGPDKDLERRIFDAGDDAPPDWGKGVYSVQDKAPLKETGTVASLLPETALSYNGHASHALRDVAERLALSHVVSVLKDGRKPEPGRFPMGRGAEVSVAGDLPDTGPVIDATGRKVPRNKITVTFADDPICRTGPDGNLGRFEFPLSEIASKANREIAAENPVTTKTSEAVRRRKAMNLAARLLARNGGSRDTLWEAEEDGAWISRNGRHPERRGKVPVGRIGVTYPGVRHSLPWGGHKSASYCFAAHVLDYKNAIDEAALAVRTEAQPQAVAEVLVEPGETQELPARVVAYQKHLADLGDMDDPLKRYFMIDGDPYFVEPGHREAPHVCRLDPPINDLFPVTPRSAELTDAVRGRAIALWREQLSREGVDADRALPRGMLSAAERAAAEIRAGTHGKDWPKNIREWIDENQKDGVQFISLSGRLYRVGPADGKGTPPVARMAAVYGTGKHMSVWPSVGLTGLKEDPKLTPADRLMAETAWRLAGKEEARETGGPFGRDGAMAPTHRLWTPAGREIETEAVIVEASDLVASHGPDGEANPVYSKILQPRQRDRKAARLQVDEMARKLRPEWLGLSPRATDGAPIVGPMAPGTKTEPNQVVESGNGRVGAILQAYRAEKGFKDAVPAFASVRKHLEDAGFFNRA